MVPFGMIYGAVMGVLVLTKYSKLENRLADFWIEVENTFFPLE
jgi:hypothetical protein